MKVEMFQGLVAGVKVFLTPNSARDAEKEWLKEHGIEDGVHRDGKAQNGTEFIVQECELKP